MSIRSSVLSLCLLALAACSNTEEVYDGPQNTYGVTFRFNGNARLAVAIPDTRGRLAAEHQCLIEADQFGSTAICPVTWQEPGEPGVIAFDLLLDTDRSSSCQAQLRTGVVADVSVELWNGRPLRISPPMATALAGRCGYTVNTRDLR